jgi:hypothetical protein
VGKFRDSYRPERHYMRGPGPKWQEKHRASFRLAASAQPKSETERELLAQSAQAAQPHEHTKQVQRFSLWLVPLTVAALLGAIAVATLA